MTNSPQHLQSHNQLLKIPCQCNNHYQSTQKLTDIAHHHQQSSTNSSNKKINILNTCQKCKRQYLIIYNNEWKLICSLQKGKQQHSFTSFVLGLFILLLAIFGIIALIIMQSDLITAYFIVTALFIGGIILVIQFFMIKIIKIIRVITTDQYLRTNNNEQDSHAFQQLNVIPVNILQRQGMLHDANRISINRYKDKNNQFSNQQRIHDDFGMEKDRPVSYQVSQSANTFYH